MNEKTDTAPSLARSANIDTLPAHALDCPCCGLHQNIPELQAGMQAHCPRCHTRLVRVAAHPIDEPLACALAALLMLVAVACTDYIRIDMQGIHESLDILTMMRVLVQQDFGLLAEIVFMLIFGTPLLFLVLCLYVFGCLKIRRALPCVLPAARILVRLRAWMMVDVFFISTLVAYIKITNYARIGFAAGFYLAPILAVLLIRTAQCAPEHWLYFAIQRLQRRDPTRLVKTAHTVNCSRCLYEQPDNRRICAVCSSPLSARRPAARAISLAFLLTAVMLSFPANLLPMMITSNPLEHSSNTIYSGIEYMWLNGDKIIALIIFSASIMIPLLKICAMSVLIYAAKRPTALPMHWLMRLYHFTESVGRWSMIDIFVVMILMAAFHTPLARVVPGGATVYFCLVVLFTMFSSLYFDPRLMWDTIRQPARPDISPNRRQP